MHLIDYLCWLDIDAALSLSGDVHTVGQCTKLLECVLASVVFPVHIEEVRKR